MASCDRRHDLGATSLIFLELQTGQHGSNSTGEKGQGPVKGIWEGGVIILGHDALCEVMFVQNYPLFPCSGAILDSLKNLKFLLFNLFK